MQLPMDFARLSPWIVRAAWAVLPFTAGPALALALDDRSLPLRTAASALLWAAWAIALCASLVLHPIALTVLRLLAPGAVASAAWAAIESADPLGALALVSSLVALTLAFLPETGESFVNGPAYPNERRFPLRVPTPLLFGPLLFSWAATIGAPIAGVLLLSDRRWVAGALVVAISVPVAVVLGRAVHGLSRRWVVFVPAGLVVHDPMSLADPVLFPKAMVGDVTVAEHDSTALDLTQRAAGLTLELFVKEPAPLVLAKVGRGIGPTVDTDRVLFTPTRPGRVLAEFRTRMGTSVSDG